MRRTRVVGLLATIGAAAAVAIVPATSAADGFIDVDLRVSKAKPFLHGVISSSNEGCENGRYVFVRKVRPGPNKFIGDDWSSVRGAWSVDVNHLGTYVIKTEAVGVCGGDKRVIRIVR